MPDDKMVKIGWTVPVSEEMVSYAKSMQPLYDAMRHELLNPPSETEMARRREARRVERRDAITAAEMAHGRVLAATDPLLHPILELHRPHFGEFSIHAECQGCDYGGYEAEPPEWPCRTYDLASGKAIE